MASTRSRSRSAEPAARRTQAAASQRSASALDWRYGFIGACAAAAAGSAAAAVLAWLEVLWEERDFRGYTSRASRSYLAAHTS